MNFEILIKAFITTVFICIPVWVCVASVLSEVKEPENDEIQQDDKRISENVRFHKMRNEAPEDITEYRRYMVKYPTIRSLKKAERRNQMDVR